jgi:hypothetical protein
MRESTFGQGKTPNAVGVAIIVRQSPDWASIDAEDYKEQSREFCRMIGRPPDQMNELMQLWNSTMSISYFETRQAMKEIAQGNLASIGSARVFHLQTFERTKTDLAQLIRLYCRKVATIDAANLPRDVAWIRPHLLQLQAFADQLYRSIH